MMISKPILTVVTELSHPSRIAETLTIILPTLGIVLAFASERTVQSVVTIRTRFLTDSASPSWCTLTLTTDVITFSAIHAVALQSTIRSIASLRTRMLTSVANVARSTHIMSSDVIARFVPVDNVRTLFLASHSVRSLRTWDITLITHPSFAAYAFSTCWITRSAILANAHILTTVAIPSWWTRSFASNSCK